MKIRYFIDKESLKCIVLGGLITRDTENLIEIEDKELFTSYYNLKTLDDRKLFLENNGLLKITMSEDDRIKLIKDLSNNNWKNEDFDISTKEDLIIVCKELSTKSGQFNKQIEENSIIINNLTKEIEMTKTNSIETSDLLMEVIRKLSKNETKFLYVIGVESVIIAILIIILFL